MNSATPNHTRHSVFLDKEDPALFKALNAVALRARESAEAAGISRELTELVNIRVSQINGCAYCLQRHTEAALEAGATRQRVAVLSAWRDTELFTAGERSALAVAEAVTELPGSVERDREFAEARRNLSDAEFSALSWIAITIGAFNRVSMVSKHPVRPPATP